MTGGARFARVVTDVVVRVPALWRVFRRPMARNFDRLAPDWDGTRVTDRYLAPIVAALAAVERAPARVLDVGTGTGAAARLAAARWPEAEIVGVDVSERMVREARARATSPRERYDVADAAALPFERATFDLVTLVNMIPFFDELDRVVSSTGAVAVAYSRGASTPIYVSPRRVAEELGRRGFPLVAHFAAGDGVSLLARRPDPS